MPQIANEVSVISWAVKCYPALEIKDIKKLYKLLGEFIKADPILFNTDLLHYQIETVWAFPFVFQKEEEHLFVEYEEYVELAEQIMILESGGRLCVNDFC